MRRGVDMRVLYDEPAFSEVFMSCLLARTMRVEEDLVDQLFNSSEKRLARLRLLLANSGEEGRPEPLIHPAALPRPRCAEEAAEAGDVVVRKLATCARAGEGRNVLVADICVPRPGTVTRPGWSLVTLPLPRHGSPA